jgi:hypothetical protein
MFSRRPFRIHVWDPPLIAAQILSLQTAYWFLLGVVVGVVAVATGEQVGLHSLFDVKSLSLTSAEWSFSSFFGFLVTSVLWFAFLLVFWCIFNTNFFICYLFFLFLNCSSFCCQFLHRRVGDRTEQKVFGFCMHNTYTSLTRLLLLFM